MNRGWPILPQLSAVFTSIIVPISWNWALHLDQELKKSLTNLLSWRILLFFHWNVLLPILASNPSVQVDKIESFLHTASFIYRLFVIVWLFLLVTYANHDLSQEEQGNPEPSELVTCRSSTLHYSISSPLLVTKGFAPPPPEKGQKFVWTVVADQCFFNDVGPSYSHAPRFCWSIDYFDYYTISHQQATAPILIEEISTLCWFDFSFGKASMKIDLGTLLLLFN